MKAYRSFCLLSGMLTVFAFSDCNTARSSYLSAVEKEFSNQSGKTELLTEKDLQGLPAPVKKYLRYTGSVGKEKIRNFRLEFKAEMYKTKDSPMKSDTEQYSFLTEYSRHFYLEASMAGIPARVFHSYADQKASMQVRVAHLFNIVDLSGEELSRTETLTVLNDLCLFAPAALTDRRISFDEVSPLSTKIFFQNGKHKVSAVLYFNETGELINFTTMERGALQEDGTMKYVKWSTPIGQYQEIMGRKIPTYGEAVNHYPEGDFAYGKFRLKFIEYNLSQKRDKIFYGQ